MTCATCKHWWEFTNTVDDPMGVGSCSQIHTPAGKLVTEKAFGCNRYAAVEAPPSAPPPAETQHEDDGDGLCRCEACREVMDEFNASLRAAEAPAETPPPLVERNEGWAVQRNRDGQWLSDYHCCDNPWSSHVEFADIWTEERAKEFAAMYIGRIVPITRTVTVQVHEPAPEAETPR